MDLFYFGLYKDNQEKGQKEKEKSKQKSDIASGGSMSLRFHDN